MNPHITSLLWDLEKTRDKYWNIGPEVGLFLHELIVDRKYKTALEIGTSNGYSGIWLADALSYNNGTLYTIESHKKERFHLATENFKKSGLTNIVQICGHAPEDIPQTPPHFDFAFFDATKNEHIKYFEAIQHRIVKGGIIVTDNIHSHEDEFQAYLELVINTPGWHSSEVSLGTGLLISYRL